MRQLDAWAMLSVSLALHAEPLKIEVFTDPAQFPVTRNLVGEVNVSIQDIAAPRRLEDAISAGLPNNEAAALQVASQRVNADLAALGARFGEAYASHGLAVAYGLTRYPAIVFDGGSAVMYGVIDLREALSRYQRWRGEGR